MMQFTLVVESEFYDSLSLIQPIYHLGLEMKISTKVVGLDSTEAEAQKVLSVPTLIVDRDGIITTYSPITHEKIPELREKILKGLTL